MSTPAKILLLDIETAPSLGWVWAKWETNVIDFKSDWYMLSYAYKWYGEKDSKVVAVGLDDFSGYKRDKENDRQLAKSLWKLMDEADIIVAHNGDGFDIPKINTRFVLHSLNPTSPYKTVDTLKIARNKFKFDSNKLDDLARYLKLGRKLPHTGFHLWKGCMSGDPASWKLMKQYNAHDIDLLEGLYELIRQWYPQHPNVNNGEQACPTCASFKVQRRGYEYTQSGKSKKQRFHCQNCARWFYGTAKKV